MAIDESHEARVDARGRGIDPLAEQAANLLAKAMLTSRDRDALWECFHALVVDEVTDEQAIRAIHHHIVVPKQGLHV